jgi:hypothetical protein
MTDITPTNGADPFRWRPPTDPDQLRACLTQFWNDRLNALARVAESKHDPRLRDERQA